MTAKIDPLSIIKEADSIMISGHVRPDGDCVGSCLGLYHYIRDNFLDKEAEVRLEEVPDAYRSAPGSVDIITEAEDEKACSLFIALDVSEKNRLGRNEKYFDAADKTLCIDHHISNPGYADYNLVDPAASSTCEIAAAFMDPDRISYNTAYALYMGMICDSGVFKYDQTCRRTMELAGMLMEKGIPFTKIIDEIFYEKTYLQQLLLAWCLIHSRILLGGRMISAVLPYETIEEYGARTEDFEGIVSQMKLTKGTAISLLATESRKGIFKCSLRSDERVDVCKIAQTFGGGGHVRASGFSYTGDIAAALHRAQQLAKEQLDTCTME